MSDMVTDTLFAHGYAGLFAVIAVVSAYVLLGGWLSARLYYRCFPQRGEPQDGWSASGQEFKPQEQGAAMFPLILVFLILWASAAITWPVWWPICHALSCCFRSKDDG